MPTEPKFSIGQKVKFINDSDHEVGEVLSFSYNPNTGWSYQISAKEVDLERKEVLNGVKNCQEDELVEVEENVVDEGENG